MSTERKTELGRDLQQRADACQALAVTALPLASAGLEGKAQAYAHCAELADAALAPVQEPLPGGLPERAWLGEIQHNPEEPPDYWDRVLEAEERYGKRR